MPPPFSIPNVTVSLCFIASIIYALGISHIHVTGYSLGTPPSHSPPKPTKTKPDDGTSMLMRRSRFFQELSSGVRILATAMATTTVSVAAVNSNAYAMDFVPASPYFRGTYSDAVDILHAQRIACDNIADVISRGDLNEAGFKLMQVSSQIRMGGKIILDEWQIQGIPDRTSNAPMAINGNGNENKNKSPGGSTSTNSAVDVLQLVKAQKKFSMLMETCDECNAQLDNALRGKLGASAVAQIKLLATLNDARAAFDDFLLEVDY